MLPVGKPVGPSMPPWPPGPPGPTGPPSPIEIVLSEHLQSAIPALVERCRAQYMVPKDVLASCVSLTAPFAPGMYIRHYESYLRVDSVDGAADLPQFDLDSSFILHANTFYPGLYAVESLSHPDHYVKSHPDSRLGIVLRSNSADFYDTASFRVYSVDASRECTFFRVFFANASFQIHLLQVNEFTYSFFYCSRNQNTTKVTHNHN